MFGRLASLALDAVNGFGQSADVVRGNASDGNATILGGVDRELLGELIHFLSGHAGVCKHANLAGDVRPVMLGAQLLQVLLKKSTHGNNAVGHTLDLAEPLLVQFGVAQDLGSDTGTVNGRIGVQGTDKNFQLRVDALLLSGVSADEGEGSDTLAVETLRYARIYRISSLARAMKRPREGREPNVITGGTYHVLGEGLTQSNLMALLNKVAYSKGILVSVTTGEALVGHIKEGEMTLRLHNVGNLFPLFGSRIDTCRVVGASVEEEDAALGGSLDIANHALKVETNRILVIVAVLLNLEARVTEDSLVVGPRRDRDVDLLLARKESLEESGANAQGTSA